MQGLPELPKVVSVRRLQKKERREMEEVSLGREGELKKLLTWRHRTGRSLWEYEAGIERCVAIACQ